MNESSTSLIDITSRSLLTSLFNSISSISPPSDTSTSTLSTTPSAFKLNNQKSKLNPPTSFDFPSPAVIANNPLRNLSANSRNLFITAHCLLPATFLAALDLLDKKLVTRVRRVPVSFSATTDNQGPDTIEKEQEEEESVYYIRSSHPHNPSGIPQPNFRQKDTQSQPQPQQQTGLPPPSKRQRTTQTPQKLYIYEVRISSWNCTCIAFTLAAYSKPHQSPYWQYHQDDNKNEEREARVNEFTTTASVNIKNMEEGRGEMWWGGTLTIHDDDDDGDGDSDRRKPVSVCKHLLAAVMVEKCGGLFEGCVVEKRSTVEEMAEMAVLWE